MNSITQKTIIVCDDDEDLLFLASSFLSKKDIKVLKAATGYEAINLFNEKKKEINLIILDNTFKNSDLQGQEILITLKKVDPTVKILISSGYPESYFRENFTQEAFNLIDGFVDKNYSSPNFIKSIEIFF